MYTSKSSGTARTLKPSRFLASLVETRTFSGKNGNEDSKEKESATKTARKVPQWSLLLADNLSTSNKKKIDDGVKKFEKSVSQGNHSEGHKKQSPKIRWDNRNQYNKNKGIPN